MFIRVQRVRAVLRGDERTELGHNHNKSARQGLAIPSYRRYSTPNALPFIIEDAHGIQ